MRLDKSIKPYTFRDYSIYQCSYRQRIGPNLTTAFWTNVDSKGKLLPFALIWTRRNNKISIHQLLCILTSKRVLRTPFAGRNHFFDAETTFSINFYHKMFKKPQKVTIKHVKKGVHQRLGVTLKCWLTWKAYFRCVVDKLVNSWGKCYFPPLLLHILHDFELLSFIFLFILFR